MIPKNTFRPGDHLVQCDRCSRVFYRSECTKDWQNLIVCNKSCYEPKHPHYTDPRPLGEIQAVRDARPMVDNFVGYGDNTAEDL